MEEKQIIHDEESREFYYQLDGERALLSYRPVDEKTVNFAHTYVPPSQRGGGLAGRITRHALEHARSQGWKVVPGCPYVARFVEKHPEYRDVTVD
jgi:hypothetical protein